jgi:MFS family permease
MLKEKAKTYVSHKPEWLVLSVAVATGLSIMGDSLMYAILPLEAKNLGISLSLVGLLLSANRLIRLVSNTPVSLIFERLGPWRPFVGSTVLGFVTALLYGTGWGFVVFLLARMGWGVAWSGLRQGGYEAIWSGSQHNKGRLMGLLWGVIRLGSAIGVVVGGYLRDEFGYQVSVAVIAGFTALAIPIASFMRWPNPDSRKSEQATAPAKAPSQGTMLSLEGWRAAFRVPARRWLLIAGFIHAVLGAVVTATASVFLAERLGADNDLLLSTIGIGTLTGGLLAVRWTSNLLFGPFIGFISDRIGQTRIIILLAILTLIGLIGAVRISGREGVLFLLPVFVAISGLFVTLSASSSGLAVHARRPHLFVGTYATATDAGSALGPLLAFNLGQIAGFGPLYLALSLLLLLSVLQYWRVVHCQTNSEMSF